MRAYVYAIVVDGIVRYIGKGSGGRAQAHLQVVRSIIRRRAAGETVKTSHFYNRLAQAWRNGADIQEIIIASGLTHEEAYAREINEIALCPDGQLWNIWRGGEGSSKGYAKSLEQRAKIADANRKTWTDPQLLAQHSERCKVQWLRPEYAEAIRTKSQALRQTPEWRARMRDNALKRWADPEFKAKMDSVFSTPEFHARRSEATKRGWATRRAHQK